MNNISPASMLPPNGAPHSFGSLIDLQIGVSAFLKSPPERTLRSRTAPHCSKIETTCLLRFQPKMKETSEIRVKRNSCSILLLTRKPYGELGGSSEGNEASACRIN